MNVNFFSFLSFDRLMASRLHNNAIEYNTEAQLKLKCYAQILGDDILEALQLAVPG